jgi:hypothetical protein
MQLPVGSTFSSQLFVFASQLALKSLIHPEKRYIQPNDPFSMESKPRKNNNTSIASDPRPQGRKYHPQRIEIERKDRNRCQTIEFSDLTHFYSNFRRALQRYIRFSSRSQKIAKNSENHAKIQPKVIIKKPHYSHQKPCNKAKAIYRSYFILFYGYYTFFLFCFKVILAAFFIA